MSEVTLKTKAFKIRGQSITEVVERWFKVKPTFERYEDVVIESIARSKYDDPQLIEGHTDLTLHEQLYLAADSVRDFARLAHVAHPLLLMQVDRLMKVVAAIQNGSQHGTSSDNPVRENDYERK